MRIIKEYFADIFESKEPSLEDLKTVIDCVQPCITPEMNRRLLAPFAEIEIGEALSKMGPAKARGPNAFHTALFQRH